MIDRPVVLVLGAGASEPYGFPLGRELVEEVEKADPNELDQELWETQQHPVSGKDEIAQFLKQLRAFDPPSIDAFLENKPQYHRVGKAIMALYLVRCEKEDDLKGDWYQYLVHEIMLSDGFDAFSENQLSVITYNYDRSFEYYLLNTLRVGFDRSAEQCADKVRNISVNHLHGLLGKVPELDRDREGRHYHDSTHEQYLKCAARGIRIVSDPAAEPKFAEARAVLRDAENVIFLGFGYLPENVKRLRLDENRNPTTRYYGTGVELRDGEVSAAKLLFPEPGIEIVDLPVREYLRTYRNLLTSE